MVKWMVVAALGIVGLYFLGGYIVSSGRGHFLIADRDVKIEVNGRSVWGEMLRGPFTAIVTTREAGNEHSYALLFAGDTDFTGNMGEVFDCRQWVAPRLPILFATHRHPPCLPLSEDDPGWKGWGLMDKGGGMEFVTGDKRIVRVTRIVREARN